MSWVRRPDHPLADEFGMVEKHLVIDEPRAASKLPRPYIVSDNLGGGIKHLATGQVLDSKSAHRKLNKELGLVELGNEKKAHLSQPAPTKLDKRERKNAIRKAIKELKEGRRI
jgi:hypothetical protein